MTSPMEALRATLEEELDRAKAEGGGDLSMVYLTIEDANAVLGVLGTINCNEGLEQWIERNFSGHGRAIRREQEEPYPGEPYMSMDDARNLVRQAVNDFTAKPLIAGSFVERNAVLEKALRRIIEIDQLEKKTVIDPDPAGCTYAVEKVDGWCADIARKALSSAPATPEGEKS